ncbi:ABC transporter ATP-binding protein [Asanoa ishikariensis]|uniref:Peptide/nickel transport system ATP-binding protein n=1 Tax=Asanoa ishikariensis TaxID=137265 RepID=A0A1H3NM18_9ACTN|nr:ATP-binding cassette domain-containing protein [Asanoa ishikariensis]GIF68521.1 ABC transporter ATP-binding protein [Asanoa ishikariensis]SDY89942.1 peptide/nickel transport system ATP-binding protein [Asanoa ishikariensis]
MSELAAHGVSVAYGRQRVLDQLSLHIGAGETVGLRGASGGGKSTLVRVLALVQAADAGHVSLDGVRITGARHHVPAAARTRIGVLFQSPRGATDPRLRLDDIVAEPLRATGYPDAAVRERVSELADLVGLTPDLLIRRPHAISDGQLQRACLARALAHRPGYLLCDEATAMLDASTQAHVARVLTDYQLESGAGILVVSHDQPLLTRWADRVIDLQPQTHEHRHAATSV